jgi:hypothetical protein
VATCGVVALLPACVCVWAPLAVRTDMRLPLLSCALLIIFVEHVCVVEECITCCCASHELKPLLFVPHTVRVTFCLPPSLSLSPSLPPSLPELLSVNDQVVRWWWVIGISFI